MVNYWYPLYQTGLSREKRNNNLCDMKKQHRKSEMYQVIGLWKESGLSQSEFIKKEKIGYHTFKYWYKKYKEEKGLDNKFVKEEVIKKEFLPVELRGIASRSFDIQGQIEIIYPNGVQMICPVGIDIRKLKLLLGV